ncbi:MAG: hypothetical protein DI533_13005 [Cereibacter sphaeroides]|uniref:DUF6473 domain-containing protein n=1 Tax=Cereibacter sphaeroides TaxID=1063 RepID=A0A2W5SDU8_CERSP|nr:MAG: hypothetical protein DI533_13005 [Cereibacter sphaeroides]
MAYADPGDGALDYFPCRYGGSKILFRGPHRIIRGRFNAVIGGTETYGKFVADPFPALIERVTGVPMLNLGCVNAGPDVFLNEPALPGILEGAEVVVVQVLGAQNLTNRFYAVHPRRNDRFLRAADPLIAMYPEVDFTEFHFTRHMLQALHGAGPARFQVLAEELRQVWTRRMEQLLSALPGRVILLRISDRPASAEVGQEMASPILVDAAMIEGIRPFVSDYVEVISAGVQPDALDGMVFAPLERLAAAEVPGPAIHRQVAAALAPRMVVAPP